MTGETINIYPAGACPHCGNDSMAILVKLDTMQITLKEIQMSQSDIDAATSAIQATEADDAVVVANIQAELAALKAANPAVDTTALDAAVAGLPAAQASLDSLETPPVVPPA